ncbi:MAG: hypothetical protein ABI210_06275, partial [Abditibacteriaceae bacterium]
INPNSHQGSEWIHLKILEAKVHANGNPDYFRTHNILGLDFGQDKIPVNKTKRDLDQTEEQLYDQLEERMTFINPKDPVVAQLLFDTGNITAITEDVGAALDIYAEARSYGYSGELIDKREKYFQQLKKAADDKQKRDKSMPDDIRSANLLKIIGILIGAIVLILMRIRNRNKRKL